MSPSVWGRDPHRPKPGTCAKASQGTPVSPPNPQAASSPFATAWGPGGRRETLTPASVLVVERGSEACLLSFQTDLP